MTPLKEWGWGEATKPDKDFLYTRGGGYFQGGIIFDVGDFYSDSQESIPPFYDRFPFTTFFRKIYTSPVIRPPLPGTRE